MSWSPSTVGGRVPFRDGRWEKLRRKKVEAVLCVLQRVGAGRALEDIKSSP